MARTVLQDFRSPQNSLEGTSVVFDTISSVTAGSMLVVGGSWEGGFGDPPSGTSDTINGSPSGVTWYTYYFGSSREVWIAYCYDHPGGSNVVITTTVANGNQRAYREGYGVELSGTVGESDPRSLTYETSTTASSGASSFSFSMPGDGTLFASVTSVASLPGFTPTSPAVLVDTLSTPTNYGACMVQATSGSGTKTIASTGGQAFLMNGIALAFNDTSSGGTTDYSETIAHGTLTVTGQALTFKLSSVAANGLITFTGQDVSFTHQTAGVYSVSIDPGLITFSSPESYSALAATIEHGTLTFTGQDITGTLETPVEYSLTIDPGVLTFSGRATNLIWSGAAITNVGGTGLSISIRMGL